jgi:uncharacterized phage protein gp47/JayE
MAFGITSAGFVRMLESDVRAAIVAALAPLFDVDPSTAGWPTAESPLSQLVDPFARQLGKVWELAEDIYQGGDPDQASGTSLDALLSLNRLTRLEASPSTVLAALSGTEGTLVPAGTRLSVTGTGELFEALAAATITRLDLIRADVDVATVATIGTQYTVTVNGVIYSSGVLGGGDTRHSIAYKLMRAVADAQVVVEAVLTGAVTVQISTLANLTAYTVTINGNEYTYTSDSSATNQEVVDGIVAALGSDTAVTALGLTSTTFSITPEVAGVDFSFEITSNLKVSDLTADGAFSLKAADLETSFTLAVDSRLTIDKLYTPQEYESVLTGAIEAPAGTLGTIENPVSGLSTTTNFLDATLGRDVESDDDARLRRQITLATGSASSAAIISRLLRGDIEGVTLVRVYENITDTDDSDGRPGHSVEVLVQGGDDTLVAEGIWETRSSGIKPYGNIDADGDVDPDGSGTGITIKDSNNTDQVIHYSRPESVYAFVTVALTFYSEEDFPVNGNDAVKDAIVAFGNDLGIGKDFIRQRLLTPIYTIPGIADATITIATSDDPDDMSPSYVSANIAIGARQVLVFDTSRITVTP